MRFIYHLLKKYPCWKRSPIPDKRSSQTQKVNQSTRTRTTVWITQSRIKNNSHIWQMSKSKLSIPDKKTILEIYLQSVVQRVCM